MRVGSVRDRRFFFRLFITRMGVHGEEYVQSVSRPQSTRGGTVQATPCPPPRTIPCRYERTKEIPQEEKKGKDVKRKPIPGGAPPPPPPPPPGPAAAGGGGGGGGGGGAHPPPTPPLRIP